MDDLHFLISEEWPNVKEEIEEMHRLRNRSGAAEAAQKGIDLFIQYLYLSNNKPVSFQEPFSFSDLEMKPINLEERFNFILSRPNLFPSFIQLCGLMEEQKKLVAKNCMMKKASSQD